MFINGDVFEIIKELKSCSIHTVFSDPPYNLSSKWKIGKKGRPIEKGKAVDFMDKWEGLSASHLEKLFKQIKRVLKFGGYCVMYGVDRQLLPFQYYALKAGLEICQSLYWYFTSGYPKSESVSRKIDKKFGLKGKIIRSREVHDMSGGRFIHGCINGEKTEKGIYHERAPESKLAKVFDGYKFGIAPFKPVLETIMVFRKPCKTQPFDDILEFENDDSISPAVVNINGSRVPVIRSLLRKRSLRKKGIVTIHNSKFGGSPTDKYANLAFPSQMLIHNNAVENLIKQKGDPSILDKIDYENEELDVLFGCSKASKKEREEGLENFKTRSKKGFNTSPRGYDGEVHDQVYRKNTHPTVKPIELNYRVFNRFLLPKKCNQKILVLFGGVGSEYIGVMKAGVSENQILGVELDQYFTRIAKARIDYYNKKYNKQKKLF